MCCIFCKNRKNMEFSDIPNPCGTEGVAVTIF